MTDRSIMKDLDEYNENNSLNKNRKRPQNKIVKKKPPVKKLVTKLVKMRIFTCPFCNEEVCHDNKFRRHLNECRKVPLMERSENHLEKHIQNAS